MLELAAEAYGINLHRSYMIGDRPTDMEAGHRAGCQLIMLNRSAMPEEPDPKGWKKLADARVSNLTEAVDLILRREAKFDKERERHDEPPS